MDLEFLLGEDSCEELEREPELFHAGLFSPAVIEHRISLRI